MSRSLPFSFGMASFTAALSTAVVVISCSWPVMRAEPTGPPERQDPTPQVYAVLINGGGSPKENYQSHWLHVQELAEILLSRGVAKDRLTVFASDGTDPAPDLAVRDPGKGASNWLIDGLPLANKLRAPTRYENSTFGDYAVYPARKEALEAWFAGAGQTLIPGDTLLIYVTDHGKRNDKDLTDNWIVLWGENLSVREFGGLVQKLPAGVRIVGLMSQCFSGSFAHVIYDSAAGREPDGSICGYFSSTPDRRAYGCYPENRGRDNVGHSFRFIEAMRSTPRFPEAHAEVLLTDRTPDVPNRTSDLYLEDLARRAAEDRDILYEDFVGELLEVAWQDELEFREEVELLEEISETFGSLDARSLSDLEREERTLSALEARLSRYEGRWRVVLQDLKRENLERFLAENPQWQTRVQSVGSDAGERSQLRQELVDELLRFTEADLTIWVRLETMREWLAPAKAARYRTQVRRATLHRLRSILVRIAGRVYLETFASPEERLAFQQVDSCEGFTLEQTRRPLAARLAKPAPFPSLDEDLRFADEAAPGWIGISFQKAPLRTVEAIPGAIVISKVYRGGPAERAGIQVGDIILGPPDDHFAWAKEIREWTMLSPVDQWQDLELLRGGESMIVSIRTDPYPIQLPD